MNYDDSLSLIIRNVHSSSVFSRLFPIWGLNNQFPRFSIQSLTKPNVPTCSNNASIIPTRSCGWRIHLIFISTCKFMHKFYHSFKQNQPKQLQKPQKNHACQELKQHLLNTASFQGLQGATFQGGYSKDFSWTTPVWPASSRAAWMQKKDLRKDISQDLGVVGYRLSHVHDSSCQYVYCVFIVHILS